MQKNKVTTYLAYALGEIVLVVIGILIALTINNWNEDRKLDEDKLTLMSNLKRELIINKELLEDHLVGLEKHNSQLNKVINYSAGSLQLPIDSLRQYAASLFYPIDLSIINTVQEEAISVGKFEILSDSLKLNLSLIKDYTETRTELNELLNGIILNKSNELDNLMHSLSAFPELPERFNVQQRVSMHPDFIKSDDEFIRLIKSSETYSKIFKLYYLSITDQVWVQYGLLDLTNETIALLEKELNEK